MKVIAKNYAVISKQSPQCYLNYPKGVIPNDMVYSICCITDGEATKAKGSKEHEEINFGMMELLLQKKP